MREADRLTLPAQNALLKTLEEPPAGTTIIMTAQEPMALLPTVLSRCRQLFLPRLPQSAIAAFLQEHGSDSAAAEEIAAASRGLPGLAIIFSDDSASLAEEGRRAAQVRQFLQTSSLFERLQLAAQIAAAGNRSDYLTELAAQVRSAARRDAPGAAAQLASVGRLQQHLQANVNPKTAFEVLAVELA
jgi:DNA polymerase-3 subunit delta'